MLEFGRHACQLVDQLDFIPIEFVEQVPIPNEVEHGAAEGLLPSLGRLISCARLAVLRFLVWVLGLDQMRQGAAPVASVHPRERRRFEGRHAPQAPQDPGHEVDQLRLDHTLRPVGLKEVTSQGVEGLGVLARDDEASGRQTVFQGIATAGLPAGLSFRAPAAKGVQSVGQDLALGRHRVGLSQGRGSDAET